MDPVTTGNDNRETRMLAAIVFTDVVGFSRLAAQNEARVYVALQRDMGVMTSLCRAHGGQVLNTMGDGMLLCFMSAVDAMTCVLEIQRTLHNQAQALPALDVLHHRIGVHLGDVIMSGDNVFGDGVNVAARLQTAAKPDSICFSQTVYEVVKNKININPVSVSQQQLKNLGEPVKMWLIPPLNDGKPNPDLADMPLVPEKGEEASGLKGGIMILVSAVLLGFIFIMYKTVKVPAFVMKPKEVVKPKVDKNVVPENNPPAEGTPAPSVNVDQVKSQIATARENFDFDTIVATIEAAGSKGPADELAKLSTYRQLQSLFQYLNEQLSQADMSAPLRVPSPDGGPELVVTTLNGQLQVEENGQYVPTTLARLGAARISAIAHALSVNQIHNRGTAPADIPMWTDQFDREFLTSSATTTQP